MWLIYLDPFIFIRTSLLKCRFMAAGFALLLVALISKQTFSFVQSGKLLNWFVKLFFLSIAIPSDWNMSFVVPLMVQLYFSTSRSVAFALCPKKHTNVTAQVIHLLKKIPQIGLWVEMAYRICFQRNEEQFLNSHAQNMSVWRYVCFFDTWQERILCVEK